jgi:hypothetical protein
VTAPPGGRRSPSRSPPRAMLANHTCQLRGARGGHPAPLAFGLGPPRGPSGSPYTHLAPLGPHCSAPLPIQPAPAWPTILVDMYAGNAPLMCKANAFGRPNGAPGGGGREIG